MKNTSLLLLIFLSFTTCSCKMMMLKMLGVKKPRPTTDQQVLQYVKDHNLDYNYIIRPKNNADIATINHYMKIASNSIVLYDSSGNEIANTNDSTCHLSLRSQITDLLRHGGYSPSPFSKNSLTLIDTGTICLSCKNDEPLFKQRLKPYILFFSFARFIPLKKPLTDIDYIQELKAEGLRDKLTIVFVNEDLHQ